MSIMMYAAPFAVLLQAVSIIILHLLANTRHETSTGILLSVTIPLGMAALTLSVQDPLMPVTLSIISITGLLTILPILHRYARKGIQ